MAEMPDKPRILIVWKKGRIDVYADRGEDVHVLVLDERDVLPELIGLFQCGGPELLAEKIAGMEITWPMAPAAHFSRT